MGSTLSISWSLTKTRCFLFSGAFQQLDAPWVTEEDTTASCQWTDLLPYTGCMDQAGQHSQCTKVPYLMVAPVLAGLYSSFSAWGTFYFPLLLVLYSAIQPGLEHFQALQAACFLACVKRPCRGPGGKDISSDPCTSTHTLFTTCHDWKKKEGKYCLYIANGKLLIPADGEMLRAQGDDF